MNETQDLSAKESTIETPKRGRKPTTLVNALCQRIPVSFVNLKEALFMHGANLGLTVVAAKKGVIIEHDPSLGLLYFLCKGKVAVMSDSCAKSFDYVYASDGGFALQEVRKNEKDMKNADIPRVDLSAEAHRAEVRARSQNAYRPPVDALTQTTSAVEEARARAMGLKTPTGKSPYAK